MWKLAAILIAVLIGCAHSGIDPPQYPCFISAAGKPFQHPIYDPCFIGTVRP